MVLWQESPEVVKIGKKTRTMDKPGGFVWHLKFSVMPGKEAQWEKHLEALLQKVKPELEENEGTSMCS